MKSWATKPVVALQGYDVDVADNQVNLTLYWASLGQTDINYTRFAHVRDETGQTIAQSDGLPGQGQYPTGLWDAGDIIADEVVIPLPAGLNSATYTFVVGLYDPLTGQRLPVPTSPTGDDYHSSNRSDLALEFCS